MSRWAQEVARLFAMPGHPDAVAAPILRRAAAAHAHLLASCTSHRQSPCCELDLIAALMPRSSSVRRRLLCHSVLIEGLHCLAGEYPPLQRWHQEVAAPSPIGDPSHRPPVGRLILGNVLASLLFRAHSSWCGCIHLSTDRFGQIRFPFSDWSISLWKEDAQGAGILAGEPVTLWLDTHHARWCLGESVQPFLITPRSALVRMIADNDRTLSEIPCYAPQQTVIPTLQCAVPLCPSGARFLPLYGRGAGDHAAVCGGVAKSLHDALSINAPLIHREFCRYVGLIQGFDLPPAASGIVQSFSEPTRPGVVGLNVHFNADDQPCLCPFCFTWLGHEMAHTKCYMIGSILYRRGWAFLNNADEFTPCMARYQRPLAIRTLFQIPYTHLYEWALLMDFLDARFRALPWTLDADPIEFGSDLRQEILESFDALQSFAQLTPLGKAALDRFWQLVQQADERWKSPRRVGNVAPRQ